MMVLNATVSGDAPCVEWRRAYLDNMVNAVGFPYSVIRYQYTAGVAVLDGDRGCAGDGLTSM